MIFYCARCRGYGHAEGWHTFAYRRKWVRFQRGLGWPVNLDLTGVDPDRRASARPA